MTETNHQPRIGVGVLIFRGGLVLLGQRKGSHGAGTWAPPGGHLEFNETLEACAAREVLEETGLTIRNVKQGAFTNDFFPAEEKHYVTLFALADADPGDPVVREPTKCARWDWFAWDELPSPLFAPLESLRAQGFVPSGTFADQLRAAATLLETVSGNRELLIGVPHEDRTRLAEAAGRVSRPDALARRQVVKEAKRARRLAKLQREESVLESTGIRQLRRTKVITSPNIFPPSNFEQRDEADPEFRESVEPQCCYICKREYTSIHHFYDQLCPECAALSYRKRTELADLTGRVALLTGGRVKIGFQAGLKLLRCGASLIVTTRFPRDSAARYAAEPDFAAWSDRLQIFGLDLRHTPSVEAFCRELLATRDRLDFIINNACQTVRRPPEFYEHMMEVESSSLLSMPRHAQKLLGAYEGLRGYHMLPEGDATPAKLEHNLSEIAGLTHAASLSQIPLLPEEVTAQQALFPKGRLDEDRQQVDLRDRNSWRMLLADVPAVELLEVQLVNAVAPFILNARLKPLMLRTPGREKHVVNVSAVEGQFYRKHKTTRHPHTNMAKAALNMMTRTSATEYHADGIHMNSVDTGWVTDEDPADIAARKVAEHRFHPPLDIIDGAARIVDPIIDGVNTGQHVWGQFLKDFRPTDW